ncbi:2-dehydro-3-deoxygluconokinase [Asanoa ferruginea]|uniref:2-dehydro-3-deoxygluconokinase n=1 Tax=Asanoa ferruginea TaxID=53367 RepID=A0A3D9ZLL5_9ACTN|nr:sugar kinase [Asanoa ferruginea]REF97484.1 2-dehydro-3-deoxygluconokinase [Asanoa ferruginea]GIF48232.1 ribokinase [Asanoa ferruginea]
MSAVDVATFGETMAALRADGPIRLGGTMRLSIAGAESNVAIGLARLGHRVRWVGLVGGDETGELVLRTLRAEGVDIGHARVDERGPTGLILFERRLGDVVRVSYHRAGSAASFLSADDVRPALEPPPRLLHVTGITPALGPGPASAVRAAAQSGVRVCLDVNYRGRLWDRDRAAAALRPLVPSLSVVVASDDELALVAPPSATTERDRVAALLDAGVAEVVIKRGAAGASGHTLHSHVDVPARRVRVVDVVGAGDAFVAGYLSGLLDHLDLTGRLDRAVSTGAFAVASPGDWEGLPTRADLELLDAQPGSTLR